MINSKLVGVIANDYFLTFFTTTIEFQIYKEIVLNKFYGMFSYY